MPDNMAAAVFSRRTALGCCDVLSDLNIDLHCDYLTLFVLRISMGGFGGSRG